MAVSLINMVVEILPPGWDWKARVFVWGDQLPEAGLIAARVGDQPVDGIVLSPEGGFTGFLASLPAAGDTLTIRLPGEDAVDTGLAVEEPLPPNV